MKDSKAPQKKMETPLSFEVTNHLFGKFSIVALKSNISDYSFCYKNSITQ